jgi:hypothetical protein
MTIDFSLTGYWTLLAVMVALFYCYLLKCYFFDAATHTTIGNEKKRVWQYRTQYLTETEPQTTAPENCTSLEIEHQFISLIDELNAFFEVSKKQKSDKNVILNRIQKILGKYPQLKTSSFRNTVNLLIIVLAQNICSILLCKVDVERVWFG